jgi:hypothetical protein
MVCLFLVMFALLITLAHTIQVHHHLPALNPCQAHNITEYPLGQYVRFKPTSDYFVSNLTIEERRQAFLECLAEVKQYDSNRSCETILEGHDRNECIYQYTYCIQQRYIECLKAYLQELLVNEPEKESTSEEARETCINDKLPLQQQQHATSDTMESRTDATSNIQREYINVETSNLFDRVPVSRFVDATYKVNHASSQVDNLYHHNLPIVQDNETWIFTNQTCVQVVGQTLETQHATREKCLHSLWVYSKVNNTCVPNSNNKTNTHYKYVSKDACQDATQSTFDCVCSNRTCIEYPFCIETEQDSMYEKKKMCKKGRFKSREACENSGYCSRARYVCNPLTQKCEPWIDCEALNCPSSHKRLTCNGKPCDNIKLWNRTFTSREACEFSNSCKKHKQARVRYGVFPVPRQEIKEINCEDPEEYWEDDSKLQHLEKKQCRIVDVCVNIHDDTEPCDVNEEQLQNMTLYPSLQDCCWNNTRIRGKCKTIPSKPYFNCSEMKYTCSRFTRCEGKHVDMDDKNMTKECNNMYWQNLQDSVPFQYCEKHCTLNRHFCGCLVEKSISRQVITLCIQEYAQICSCPNVRFRYGGVCNQKK